ncbi:MAG TPA: class I SAM-dependent methyltransferase [Methanobacterium sp.]|nr:class I SAM-dependent methyltransferase [Methanobacterium sp.]
MQLKLESVSETLLVPLWARATETKHANPIIKDEKAIEMMEQIDYDFSKFDDQWPTQVSIAIRTEILDCATKSFIDKYPEATIINLGCGLDTRFLRVDNGEIRWYDLDLPEPMEIRKQFFHNSDRYKMIAKSVFDYSWIDNIESNEHVLIIAEGLMMYFTEDEVKELINKLINSFKGAEMLLETIPTSLVKQSQKQDLIKKQYQMEAQFQWGIKKGKDLEKLNNQIKFIEDWHYFDFHKDRWKAIRWLSLIPTFKTRFGNRIVHIKLN